MKGQPKWDIATIRSAVARVHLIRTMSLTPKRPLKTAAERDAHLAYTAGFDDCCEIIDRLLRKMTEAR